MQNDHEVEVDQTGTQMGNVSQLSMEQRRAIMMLAIALFAAGALFASRECLVASVICAGAAMFAKRIFG
jgi:hypothetical protein